MSVDDQRERLIANGWRQGVILPSPVFNGLVDLPEDVDLIAISQTCDLLQPDFRKEPFALFLVVRKPDALNPATHHGNHPRTLQFRDSSGTLFEGQAWDQHAVPHEVLLEVDASKGASITEPTRRVLASWLAKRFERIAFPDEFVSCLDRAKRKTKKALKRSHHLFSEILLAVSPFRDLEEGETYEIICRLLMEDGLYEDAESLNDAEAFALEFEELLKVGGIDVKSCEVISESDLSVAELKALVRLDYDHLSFKDETG